MTSPSKPTDNRLRVFRGGSWGSTSASVVRAAFRYGGVTPTYRNPNVGFRTAQTGCRQQVLKVTP